VGLEPFADTTATSVTFRRILSNLAFDTWEGAAEGIPAANLLGQPNTLCRAGGLNFQLRGFTPPDEYPIAGQGRPCSVVDPRRPMEPESTLMQNRSLIVGLFLLTFCRDGLSQQHSSCRGPQALELAVQQHPTAENWSALAGWFGEQRQYACAAPAFHAALKMEPRSASLHYFLGLTLQSSGQSEAAIAELQRSIELDPAQLQPRLVLGVALNSVGRMAESQEAWEAALRVDPNSLIALDWLAKARISSGQFDAAIELLTSAPPDESLTLDLALAYSQSNQFDKAIDTLEAAVAQAPGDPRMSAALATVYVQSHRYQDATNLLRAAASLHPDDLTIQLLYLRVLVLQDDDSDAEPLAKRFLDQHPHDFDALYLSGVIENDQQQFAEAAEHLKAAVALDPNHYDARFNLGNALFHLQQNEVARTQLEKAVALDPSQAEGHFHLAQVLRALGQTAEAQAQLKLFQQEKQATVELALGQTKAGQAAQALKDGHADQAAALYREAIAAQPQNASFEFDLAQALSRTGDPGNLADQRAALEKAVQLKPNFAAAENQLGYLAAQAGDSAAAERHFRNALTSMPRFAEAANNLGTLLGQEGHDAEAEKYFRSALSANPRSVQAWVNLAATLASESRFPEARAAVESALQVSPQDADALRLQQMLPATQNVGNPTTGPATSGGASITRKPN
jgi:tetratricopeptide (TPR) repeat protein